MDEETRKKAEKIINKRMTAHRIKKMGTKQGRLSIWIRRKCRKLVSLDKKGEIEFETETEKELVETLAYWPGVATASQIEVAEKIINRYRFKGVI